MGTFVQHVCTQVLWVGRQFMYNLPLNQVKGSESATVECRQGLIKAFIIGGCRVGGRGGQGRASDTIGYDCLTYKQTYSPSTGAVKGQPPVLYVHDV